VTSSRESSSSSRDPVITPIDSRFQPSTNADLVLPFPQEVSRTSTEYDDCQEVSEAAADLSTTHGAEYDAIKQAKDSITNGVTSLEKHYDLVNSRLRNALRHEREQLECLQQQLDDVVIERTRLQSENVSLKEHLTKSEREVERLQQKEIVNLKTRFSVEEELIKLRSSGHSGSQFEQLKTELRETKDALEKVSQEKLDLENQLSKLMLLEKSRKSRLLWLATLPAGKNTLQSTSLKTKEVLESNVTLTVTPPSGLQMTRHENTALLTYTLPEVRHARRHARHTEDVLSFKPFGRSAAGVGMLPMISKQPALAPSLQ